MIGRIHEDYLDPDRHLWSEGPCEVCGGDPADCDCPECHVCGEAGNPACEINRGKLAEIPHVAALDLIDALPVDDLYGVYRAVYRTTDCGPMIGFRVAYIVENDNGEAGPGGTCSERREEWIYGDDLRKPLAGTPYRLIKAHLNPDSDDPAGPRITGISVGSIVEGVDQCCETLILEGQGVTRRKFWEAVEAVNAEAQEIWNATHGCDDCPENPDNGYHQIDPNCPSCKGEGVIL